VDGDDQYVVATMGTAALGTMTEFVAASGVAARDAGRPLVVLGSKCVQAALPGRIESATYLSLSRALRNAAAVIHPGGMGTSATALATGVPSVLVPRAFDQRHNARRLEHAGVGVLVRRRGLNPAAVSGALRRALEKPIASQARAVARGLIGDPAREAADLVESWCIPNPRSQDPEAACRGERR
jgi:UDP:flavonoid glycosyltransferase YjiC (YdhE family)